MSSTSTASLPPAKEGQTLSRHRASAVDQSAAISRSDQTRPLSNGGTRLSSHATRGRYSAEPSPALFRSQAAASDSGDDGSHSLRLLMQLMSTQQQQQQQQPFGSMKDSPSSRLRSLSVLRRPSYNTNDQFSTGSPSEPSAGISNRHDVVDREETGEETTAAEEASEDKEELIAEYYRELETAYEYYFREKRHELCRPVASARTLPTAPKIMPTASFSTRGSSVGANAHTREPPLPTAPSISVGELPALLQHQPFQTVWTPWRIRERMKTVSVALTLCLNIGVDPPDIVKTDPCAKLECWVDPFSLPPQRALESIGKNLQAQYEVWQPRARYKQALDPTAEEIKKLCLGLRRNAKDDRVLFHYNGHGVPKPTASGELWVFNKNYTQYIPVSIYDIQNWMAAPSIYVYDCSAAGRLMTAFFKFAEQRDREALTHESAVSVSPVTGHSFSECIQLAACSANEILPMHPDLPADVFTSCLTTPIEVALRWFLHQNPLLHRITPDMISKIPGRLNDRRTPLGELNWIFTAITDTIAWNTLPRELFKKLFRQDLMVAALFRNFLLAERILRSYLCTPMSSPPLPPTYQHPLWSAWDLAADMCLAQLPALLDETNPSEYMPSSFFAEQLTAFEVWLERGVHNKRPPEQLPIVLQVLLSQTHRLRALVLLSKFLDLGPWAVNQALAVGIFPYVLKLLQSPAMELKLILVFIWARIMAVDRSCQQDLLKDNGFQYFVNILLASNNVATAIPDAANLAEMRAMCAFVLSVFCHGFRNGQAACLRSNVVAACAEHFGDRDSLLRQWACICLGTLCSGFAEAKALVQKDTIHARLFELLKDPVPEVRAASIYALNKLLSSTTDRNDILEAFDHNIALHLLYAMNDGSPLVRKELALALGTLVRVYHDKFVDAAFDYLSNEKAQMNQTTQSIKLSVSNSSSFLLDRFSRTANLTHHSIYSCVWKVLLNISMDPFPEVAKLCASMLDDLNFHMVLSRQATELDVIFDDSHNSTFSGFSTSNISTRNRQAMQRSNKLYETWIQTHRNQPTEQTLLKPTRGFGLQRSNSELRSSAASVAFSRDGDSQKSKSVGLNYSRNLSSLDSLADDLDDTNPNLEPEHPIYPNSQFFNWSLKFFTEPRLKNTEDELPGGDTIVCRSYRRKCHVQYLEKIVQSHAAFYYTKMDRQVNLMDIQSDATSQLVFHPFDDNIIVTDSKNRIQVWQYIEPARVNLFSNGNLPGTRITSLQLINDKDFPFLMTGADDGIVRIFRNYQDNNCDIVSSWRAMPELLPDETSPGLLLDWQQICGHVICGGDTRSIRIWDAEREFCIMNLPSSANASVSSITSDKSNGNLIIAGCGDGSIHFYDKRCPAQESMVLSFHEHEAWVLNVMLQRGSNRQLMSGSVNGDIRFWDSRFSTSVSVIDADAGRLSSLALHDYCPIFVVGSQSQQLKVFHTDGTLLSNVRYHDGFLGQRIAPVTAVKFHPYDLLLASGGSDQLVSVHGPSTSIYQE